jgi:acetolactate synthase-1/2/3 large subunit
MGYAVPGAVAVKLAQPERPVVAVVGDGALLMYAGELATVARLGRPLVVLVVVDEALALIRLKQRRQNVPTYGTEFSATDYQALAAAFGLAYRLIDGRQNATAILHDALAMTRPALVEARINKAEYDHFK